MTNIRSAPWRRQVQTLDAQPMKLEKSEQYRTGNTAVDIEDFYGDQLPIIEVPRPPNL